MQFIAAEFIIFCSIFYLCVKVIDFFVDGNIFMERRKKIGRWKQRSVSSHKSTKSLSGTLSRDGNSKLLLKLRHLQRETQHYPKLRGGVVHPTAIEVEISQLSGAQVLQNYVILSTD